jgi:hypothetical protein
MSKPNLLGFRTSIGFYRNKRVLDLEALLAKYLPGKIERAKLAPTCFQVVMAYAAENQTDGNFEGYTPARWSQIFAANNLPFTTAEATNIVKAFREVGLFDGDKIRSWSKFNREFAHYETLTKYRQRAGKLSAKRREMEAKSALKNGHAEPSNPVQNGGNPAPKPAQKGAQTTKEIWLLNEQLKETGDPGERKQLERRKRELLRDSTGVKPASSSPAPSAPAAPKKSDKQLQAEWRRGLVVAGLQALEQGGEDIITESMALALVDAGHQLPPSVEAKFRKALKSRNPVPE